MERPMVPAVRNTFANGSAFSAARRTLPFERSATAAAAAPPIHPRFFGTASGAGGGIGFGLCICIGDRLLLSEQLACEGRNGCEQCNDAFLPGNEQGEQALPELRDEPELGCLRDPDACA